MAWVFLRYPETDGAQLASEESASWFESRGWVRHVMPDGLDANDPQATASLAEVLDTSLLPERILSEDEALALKGQALDDALAAAGLSKAGTADEKRARLAEHEAELATTTEEEEVSNG